MGQLWKNKRGAVTVMVTLLIIPSLLLTGTAVDVSRIYAAKSIVADANSLAANSVLADYNALLQDLYGLYGIKDEKLQTMVNEYIQVAVFGDGNTGKGLGTFQLFYGSESSLEANVDSAQTLEKTEVLRRQIEEYMKLRAPVVITEKVMEIMDSLEKTSADAEAIETKMEIEDELNDIKKEYQEIYNLIQELDGFQTAGPICLMNINANLDKINDWFENLYAARDAWQEAYRDDDEELQKDLEKKYDGILSNIAVLADGGTYYEYYSAGDYNDEGEFEIGEWEEPHRIYNDSDSSHEQSLSGYVKEGETVAEEYADVLNDVVEKLKKTEEKKVNLKQKLEELKGQLENCSSDLKDGMTKKQEIYGNRSLIETYEDLLEYDLGAMADQVNAANAGVFQQFKALMGEVGYGRISVGMGAAVENTCVLSVQMLSDFQNEHYMEQFQFDYLEKNTKGVDVVKQYKNLTKAEYHYSMPQEYTPFCEVSTACKKFYDMLKELMKSDDSEKEKNVKKELNKMLKGIQEKITALTNSPEGAYYYQTSGGDDSSDLFGGSGDWGTDGAARESTKKALNDNFISSVGNLADDMVDKLLLIVYDTEMFSNYATNKAEEGETSLAGIPYGVDVNYYYQSEQEYLFHGDTHSAENNLNAVTEYIFLIRFICNYITSFTLVDINQMVQTIMVSLPFPVNLIVAGLARYGVVMGQSLIDVMDLRGGGKVPIFHDKNSWTLSLQGIMEESFDALGMLEDVLDSKKRTEKGFSYSDYLTVLLLFRDGDTLAKRTGFLIELNLTNYKGGLGQYTNNGERESQMSALALEYLSEYMTGFTITTEVEMDTLFLSMPMAQKGINGVRPETTFTIQDTVYRGY